MLANTRSFCLPANASGSCLPVCPLHNAPLLKTLPQGRMSGWFKLRSEKADVGEVFIELASRRQAAEGGGVLLDGDQHVGSRIGGEEFATTWPQ